MTWTKLSDDFADECWTLSSDAFRLLVEMLTYSNRRLLNCLIPHDEFRRFAKHPEALAELLRGGWCVKRGDLIEVVYHASYQRERDMQLAIQKRNAENGKKGGRPRAPRGLVHNPGGNRDGNPEGQDRSGQDSSRGDDENSNVPVPTADQRTGEVLPVSWLTAVIPGSAAPADPGYCKGCGGPLPCRRDRPECLAAQGDSTRGISPPADGRPTRLIRTDE